MSTYRLYVLKTLEDHKDADSFLALAEQRLKTIKSHKFTWWDPSLLLPVMIGKLRSTSTCRRPAMSSHFSAPVFSPP